MECVDPRKLQADNQVKMERDLNSKALREKLDAAEVSPAVECVAAANLSKVQGFHQSITKEDLNLKATQEDQAAVVHA